MYISHSHKFVILRNRKCASTSLVNLALDFCDVNHTTCEEITGLTYNEIRHYNAIECKLLFDRLGWDFNSYKIVTTIRNPWDRVVSAYHYEKDVVKNPKLELMSFSDYLESRIFENFSRKNNFRSFAFDGNENLVTHVLLTEGLDEMVSQFCISELGISVGQIEWRNKTERGSYERYYNESSRALIESKFESDISFGGYVF